MTHVLLALLATLPKVNPSDYPSANTILIQNDQAVVYQADGQFTNTLHEIKMVLTPTGKSEAATMAIDYTKDAEKVEVVSAQVIKADGSVIKVPASAMKDTEQTGDMNIYDPQGRALRITFEGLAVGDATDVTYRLTRTLPTRPG